MKKILLSAIIAFLAINLGLYAQDTAQTEPKIKLELVWEKGGNFRSNFVFLDEEGYNPFSSMCKNSTKAIENKRMLYIGEGKIQFLQGNDLKSTNTIDLGYSPRAEISKNGKNIVVVNPVHKIGDLIEPTDGGTGEPTIQKIVHQEGEPAILRLFNSNGELLAEDTVGLPSDIYPLGNDKVVILEYGEWSHIEVYCRNGMRFKKVQEYDGYFLDYSEDGNYAVISVKPYEEKKRVIIDNNGNEYLVYYNEKVPWRGFISPQGNYIAEVTRGKYIVIFDKRGNVIAEHHVQGIGNYHGFFSLDERYLCITPGRWRVYFLKTETGELISEYLDSDTTAGFQAIAISSEPVLFFVGSTIVDPVINRRGLFTTADRGLYIFNSDGLLIEKLRDVFSGAGFGSPLMSAALWCKDNYLLVGTPTKCYLYRILQGGEK